MREYTVLQIQERLIQNFSLQCFCYTDFIIFQQILLQLFYSTINAPEYSAKNSALKRRSSETSSHTHKHEPMYMCSRRVSLSSRILFKKSKLQIFITI